MKSLTPNEEAKLRELVPAHLQQGMKIYIECGIQPGDFLSAVLENNLMEAMGRADEISRSHLYGICQFIYCYAPHACHGSRLKIYEWVKRGGMQGPRDEAAA